MRLRRSAPSPAASAPIGGTPLRSAAGRRIAGVVAALAVLAASAVGAVENDDGVLPLIKEEQRRIRYRDPASLPNVYIPPTAPPPTVDEPRPADAERMLPLDEAIGIALANSDVVRALAGSIAVSTGRTVYDPAIANTQIDQQRAAFDPALVVNNTFTQFEPPVALPDPGDPNRTIFTGIKTENHNVSASLAQTNLSGGAAQVSVFNDASRFSPGLFALNPQNRYATGLSYTQPLLRGSGVLANRVPIVLARIDTERSFFQLRDALQELVRGVIEAYWAVVFSRTNVWAREIQVEQSKESVKLANARLRIGLGDATETSQALAALAQFEASLIAARADLITRETALASILGMPPTDPLALVPTTPPTSEQIAFDWNELTQIAQVRRPDLIELKLILEADQQRLILARNQMQPNLDLVGLYRWNGLEGRMPDQSRIGTNGNEATDWTLGVNFSVPLLLRQERAAVRSAELLIARDRATLEQGVLTALHLLALSYRNLDQFFAQYEAYQRSREAARINLEQQFVSYRIGREVVFVNVLQAISDWGNSVSLQAQALSQYNIELANIELQTGTILETHGIFLYEDRFCSLGPLWVAPKHGRLYPRDIHPGQNAERYPTGSEPSEEYFDLKDYPRRLPPADLLPPADPTPPPPEVEVVPPVAPSFDAAPPSPQLQLPPSVGGAP